MAEYLGLKLPGGLEMEVGFEAGIPWQLHYDSVKLLWSIVVILTTLANLLAAGSLCFAYLVVATPYLLALTLYRFLESLLTGAAAPERASCHYSVFRIIFSVVRVFSLPLEFFALDVLFFAAQSWVYGWKWSDEAQAKVKAVLHVGGVIVGFSAYVFAKYGLWHEAAHLVCNALIIGMVASRFVKVELSFGSSLFTWIVAYRLVEVLLIFAADALKLECAMWMSFWQRYWGAELLHIPYSSVVMSYRTVNIATSGDPLRIRPPVTPIRLPVTYIGWYDVSVGLERSLTCLRNFDPTGMRKVPDLLKIWEEVDFL